MLELNKVVFICERKFPCDGSFTVDQKLYHLTSDKKLNSIKKDGMCPKNLEDKIAWHPKRIYFCKNITCIKNFINELKNKKKNFEPYSLITIDPSNLFYHTPTNKTEQIYFFNDPRKPESVYTTFNIRPNDIKIIQSGIINSDDIKITN
jgi:hypothetical protein